MSASGKSIALLGVHGGGFGEGAAQALQGMEGVKTYGLARNPEDEKKQALYESLGIEMVPASANVDAENSEVTEANFKALAEHLPKPLDALVQLQAGGFVVGRPTREEMQALRSLQKLEIGLEDLPEDMVRRAMEVFALSHGRVIRILAGEGVVDGSTRLISTSYNEAMTGYTHELKRLLEYEMAKLADEGFRSLSLAIPRALTDSSKVFNTTSLFIVYDYLTQLEGKDAADADMQTRLRELEKVLSEIEGVGAIWGEVAAIFLDGNGNPRLSDDEINDIHGDTAKEILTSIEKLKEEGQLNTLKDAAAAISGFVRHGTGRIIAEVATEGGVYLSGELLRVRYEHLLNIGGIGKPKVDESLSSPTEIPEIFQKLSL